MTGEEIVNLAVSIVRRQDATIRTEMITYINSARKAVLRDQKINRLYRYVTNVPLGSGVIDMAAQLIKSVRVVEYDNGTTKTKLAQVYSYQEVVDLYGSLAASGTPTGFFELGASLYILPAPTAGTINIYGEFWPADLADLPSSADITTVELGDAWGYLGAALYFSVMQEFDKAQYWQQIGLAAMQKYIAQGTQQAFDTTDAWNRRPFGVPLRGRIPATAADLDDGGW